MPRQIVIALTFGLALLGAIAAVSATAAHAQEMKMPRTISLVGHADVKVAPDQAVVTVGVLKQAPTAAEALSANTAAMSAVISALKSSGIAPRDMQTSNFMVAPRYDYGDNTQPPKLNGYDVSNNVTVTVRQIAKLGSLLDTLVNAGSNQINGVSFQVSEPENALDAARKLATADATRKARLYAAAMQVQLGPVLSLNEGGTFAPPVPMMKTMRGGAEMSADVPVAAGEQTLSIDVNVTWEIR